MRSPACYLDPAWYVLVGTSRRRPVHGRRHYRNPVTAPASRKIRIGWQSTKRFGPPPWPVVLHHTDSGFPEVPLGGPTDRGLEASGLLVTGWCDAPVRLPDWKIM